jgi:hypothetical protein
MNENPYASPSPRYDKQTVYYAMDLARSSLGEIWRVGYPNLVGIGIALLAKLFGCPLRGNVGIAYGSIAFVEVSEVPAHVVTALEPICRDCESFGFRKRFAYRLPVLGNAEAYAIMLSNLVGSISSQACYVRNGKKKESIVAFLSYLDDESVLSTTNGRRRLRTPPAIDVSYLPGSTVGQVLARHESRIASAAIAQPRSLDDAELRDAVTGNVRRAASFHEARGVYVPLTNAEVAKLKVESARIGK